MPNFIIDKLSVTKHVFSELTNQEMAHQDPPSLFPPHQKHDHPPCTLFTQPFCNSTHTHVSEVLTHIPILKKNPNIWYFNISLHSLFSRFSSFYIICNVCTQTQRMHNVCTRTKTTVKHHQRNILSNKMLFGFKRISQSNKNSGKYRKHDYANIYLHRERGSKKDSIQLDFSFLLLFNILLEKRCDIIK